MVSPPYPLRTGAKHRSGILNIAHRGARAFSPENTLAAFAKAKTFGCPMFEIDVHLSKDGEIIVYHDDHLTRCTDVKSKFPGLKTYFVSDFTCDELKALDAGDWFVQQMKQPLSQRSYPLQSVTQDELDLYTSTADLDYYASGQVTIPTLKETLDFARAADMMINIELKMLPRMYPGLTDAVVTMVESLGMDDSVLISSFDHEQLVQVRRRSNRIATAVLTGDRLACPGRYLEMLDADAYHPSTGNSGFSSLTGMLDSSGIVDVIKSGRSVNVWTCNEKQEMRQLIAAGVTGLISDFPNRVNEVIRGA